MNKKAIRLLEEARTLRDKAFKTARDAQALASIVQTMRALPMLDARPMNEVLYDASGMPK